MIMLSLQTIRQLVESIKAVFTSIYFVVDKLENCINKQPNVKY